MLKSKQLFEVEEITYEDGKVLYSINGKEEDGTTFSIGNFDDMDLIIEILKMIGKIEGNCKTYTSNSGYKD